MNRLGIVLTILVTYSFLFQGQHNLQYAQSTSSELKENGGPIIHIREKLLQHSIAFVLPLFTASAYNNAFYLFYKKYAYVNDNQNITHNLDLLSSKVTTPKGHFNDADAASSSSAVRYLAKHTSLLLPSWQISILTDIDIDKGGIFDNTSKNQNRYAALIIGHHEYVTAREYANIKKFVANGGILILLDSNSFYAEVGYDPFTKKITLIKGHNWEFNGKTARKSIGDRWANDSSKWVGSRMSCTSCRVTFANNPFDYFHHEEQYITSPDVKMLLNYNVSVIPNNLHIKNASLAHMYDMGAYELGYGQGKVISFGIYADDISMNKAFVVFFDRLLLSNLN